MEVAYLVDLGKLLRFLQVAAAGVQCVNNRGRLDGSCAPQAPWQFEQLLDDDLDICLAQVISDYFDTGLT
ncbi:hypothetical protein M0R45_033603 [Rubus argutus]|uniref:Uncharacterized protein n=1 Tax=Rubus argutus TaxID=59490 RepID=A0AAW1WNW3_RUBAR